MPRYIARLASSRCGERSRAAGRGNQDAMQGQLRQDKVQILAQRLEHRCRGARPRSSNPSSDTERTTRSSSLGVLINGKAGRPRISSASSAIAMWQGAVSKASRMALTPFEPPTVIVFQIGVSRAVRLVLRLLLRHRKPARDGRSWAMRGACPAACPVNNATGKNTTRWRAQRQITGHSIAPPFLAIRSQCAVISNRTDVTWIT